MTVYVYALAEFLFISASHSTRRSLPSCL